MRFVSTWQVAGAKADWNSALVRFGPDDVLRSMEFGTASLQVVKKRCKFVGYDNVRRNEHSPILRMSQVIRTWAGSEHETPGPAKGSAAHVAEGISSESAGEMCAFLLIAFEAWGRDAQYAKLWGSLNLTLTMWLYRRMVLAPIVKTERRTRITSHQFGQCCMFLSASSTYLEYLVGRQLNDDHRSPTYDRIVQLFKKRLADDNIRGVFPKPHWTGGHRAHSL